MTCCPSASVLCSQSSICIHPGAVPVKVAMCIGELAGVNPDALAFSFHVLTSGTELDRLTLEVQTTNGDELRLAYLDLEEP
jgi:Zn finger protein HypA/HybF involved in hydrogenase expression